MTDELNITIRIAQQAPIPLVIDRREEETIRNAEYHVNQLWKMLKQRFPDRNPVELLALVALQFARRSNERESALAEANEAAEQIDTALSRLIDMMG